MFSTVVVFLVYVSPVNPEEFSVINSTTEQKIFRKKNHRYSHHRPFVHKLVQYNWVHDRFEHFSHPKKDSTKWNAEEKILLQHLLPSLLLISLVLMKSIHPPLESLIDYQEDLQAERDRNIDEWFCQSNTNCSKTCSITNSSTFPIGYKTFNQSWNGVIDFGW